MKFLPSTTDSNSFGWEDLFLLIAVAVIPALCFFLWIMFFRKQSSRRRHRRRRRIATQSAYARTTELPSVSPPDKAPGEPKS